MSEILFFTKKGLDGLIAKIAEFEKRLKHLQSQTAYVAEVGGDQYHDNASYELLVIDIRGADWRLRDAYQQLNQAVVFDPPSKIDVVSIGTRVTIMRDNKIAIFDIVGFGESDPKRNRIAYNAPLAILLINRSVGEKIVGVIAGKQVTIVIINISLQDDRDEN